MSPLPMVPCFSGSPACRGVPWECPWEASIRPGTRCLSGAPFFFSFSHCDSCCPSNVRGSAFSCCCCCAFSGDHPCGPRSRLLAFAVFLRGWYAVAEGRAKPYVFGGVAALLCATAFLVAADQGIYAMSALLVTLAAVAIDTRRRIQGVRTFSIALLSTVVGSAVLVIVINSLFAKPFDFRFWRDSFAQVSAYRWATPFPMIDGGSGPSFRDTHRRCRNIPASRPEFDGAGILPLPNGPASCLAVLSSA